MKKRFRFFLMMFSLCFLTFQLNGQVLCKSKKVMPVVSFNQCSNSSWQLFFEDDFSGNSLDTSKWEIITGVPRDPYFKVQKSWCKNENVVVEDGSLKIYVREEKLRDMEFVADWSNPYIIKDDFEYTSGEIWTKEKFGYGKYEARIKIPKGKGFWPAFWTFGGPVYNEIDIFEFWNNNVESHKMTAHYNGRMCLKDYNGPDFSEGFHIFTLIWEKDRMEWYVDGVLKRKDLKYYTLLGQETGCKITAGEFYLMNNVFPRDPMQVILSIGIQNGEYTPDETTPFPSFMEIDWFRYYRKDQ